MRAFLPIFDDLRFVDGEVEGSGQMEGATLLVPDAFPPIPDDEPVVILRARDVATPAALRAWADQGVAFGMRLGLWHALGYDLAAAIEEWQKLYGAEPLDLVEYDELGEPTSPDGADVVRERLAVLVAELSAVELEAREYRETKEAAAKAAEEEVEDG